MADISKVCGSLVKRIALVLIVLMIIPLAIDAVLLIRRDDHIEKQAAENQLTLMVESFQIYFNQFVQTSVLRLHESSGLEGVSSAFTFDQELKCTWSTVEEMKGKGDFFIRELKRAFKGGRGVFLGLNPYTGVDEVFVILRKGDELHGLSMSETLLLNPFEQLSPFSFALVKEGAPAPNRLAKRGLFPNRLAKRNLFPNAQLALEVSIPKEAIAQFEGGGVYHHLFTFLSVILVVGSLGTIWLIRKMARPLNQLSAVMEAVGNQDYSRRYQTEGFGFEINALGTHFNGMLEKLLHHIEEAKNERVGRELLSQEFKIGHEIQRELFPKEIPTFPGIQLGSCFLAAKEVTGDFFDAFPLSEQELFFVIADGSDKGISACLYSLIVRSMLRTRAKSGGDLADLVKKTNHLFCRDTKDSGNFVTAWMGILNVETDILKFVNAGHLPALLLHSGGKLEELTTAGIALGVTDCDRVEVGTEQFPSGATLFLYSDGVTDSQNKKGELFGKDRLFDFLNVSLDLEPEQLVDGVIKCVEEFTSTSEPFDDLTMLSLKRV